MLLGKLRKKYKTLNEVLISASALRHNLQLYRDLLPGQAICPVLKSNAYGHGLTLAAKIFDELPSNSGEKQTRPEFLIVDSLYEAYKLKEAKIQTPILILGYTLPENLKNKRHFPFHFAVSDLESAKILAAKKTALHLEIDTGMSRSGFTLEELPEALTALQKMGANISGIFTHFADADNPNSKAKTDKQCQLFQEAIHLTKEAGFQPKWMHASNSAGALKARIPELNMARVGISLYGLSPLQETDPQTEILAKLKPVMEVTSTIIEKRKIKAGQSVSYNCTFTAEKDMEIGIIPFGYYEGIPRSLSSLPPFLGRICMNHAIIDLTDPSLQALDLNPGDKFTVYSSDPAAPNSFHNMAKLAGTITYELTTKISESIRRRAV
jgi:alanine racemase